MRNNKKGSKEKSKMIPKKNTFAEATPEKALYRAISDYLQTISSEDNQLEFALIDKTRMADIKTYLSESKKSEELAYLSILIPFNLTVMDEDRDLSCFDLEKEFDKETKIYKKEIKSMLVDIYLKTIENYIHLFHERLSNGQIRANDTRLLDFLNRNVLRVTMLQSGGLFQPSKEPRIKRAIRTLGILKYVASGSPERDQNDPSFEEKILRNKEAL